MFNNLCIEFHHQLMSHIVLGLISSVYDDTILHRHLAQMIGQPRIVHYHGNTSIMQSRDNFL